MSHRYRFGWRFPLGAATVMASLAVLLGLAGSRLQADAPQLQDADATFVEAVAPGPGSIPVDELPDFDLNVVLDEFVEPIEVIPYDGIGGAQPPENYNELLEGVNLPYDGPIWEPDGTEREDPAIEDMGGFEDAPPLLQSFRTVGPNGTPPDPHMGVGIDHIVVVINFRVAVYDKCGVKLFDKNINDFLGVSGFLFDPKVMFDPWNSRWVMLWLWRDTGTKASQTILVISGNNKPFGIAGSQTWFYRINAAKKSGAKTSWADYYDLGYGRVALYAAGNQFFFEGGFHTAMVRIWSKAKAYAREGLGTKDVFLSDFAPRTAHMQVVYDGFDEVLAASSSGGGNKITLRKIKDPLGAATFTNVNVTVGAYDPIPDPLQPNGVRLFSKPKDCRLMNAVVTWDAADHSKVRLYTSNHDKFKPGGEPDRAAAHLYEIDARANTQTFGRVFFSNRWYYTFPSVAADYQANAFWVFTRCGVDAGMFAEARFVDLQRGVFSNSSRQIKSGTSNYGGGRWGDYFQGQIDWRDYFNDTSAPRTKMWLVGEAATAGSYVTWVGAAVPDKNTTRGVMSVTPTTPWCIVGPKGGPWFRSTSRLYTVKNSGQTSLVWALTGKPSWLDVSNSGAPLNGGKQVNTSVSLNATGKAHAAGTYAATLKFTDCFTGGAVANRAVTQTVLGGTLLWNNNLAHNSKSGRAISPPGFPNFRVVDEIKNDKRWRIAGVAIGTIDDAGWLSGRSMQVYVYKDDGGKPSTLEATQTGTLRRCDTGEVLLGRKVYYYTVEGLNIELPPGTHWIGARMPNGGGSGTNYWLQSNGGPDGGGGSTGYFSIDAGSTWIAEGADWHHAFLVLGETITEECDPCDTNCDGSVDLTDVEPFIKLLLMGGRGCSECSGDTNGDGSVDLTDVEGFIKCLLG